MESKFSKKIKSGINTSTLYNSGYGGKVKTGTQKTKLKTPKIKIAKSTILDGSKKPRKSKERIDRIPSSSKESKQDLVKTKNDTIPAWIRESNKQKSSKKEGEESKLQWRKETKKSQRSFSKNKERDYIASKSKYENIDEKSRKPFGNTFEKKDINKPTSSWDKNSIKPGSGFEKSKTGYNRSTAPIKSTRKWDTDTEKSSLERIQYNQGDTTKSSSKKNTTQKLSDKKTKYIAPKPSWEKENEVIDKKKLKDPTK